MSPGCTRYPEELLCKYFRIYPKPEDATGENTIYLKDLTVLVISWHCCQYPDSFDESILDEGFAKEMEEYNDFGEDGKESSHILIKANAKEYMQLVKALGVRPTAVLAGIYAKAVIRVMGETDRKMKVAIPMDFRDALEIPRTF